jgi:glutaredoxin-related protein
MATRRLMQGRRGNEDSPQITRARQQSAVIPRPRGTQASVTLPPYEAPSCPLTMEARQQLSQLNVNYDYTKYRKHIENCRLALTGNIADSFDRVNEKNAVAERQSERRRRAGGNEDEQTEEELEAIKAAKDLETRVLELQAKAEKAFRDLVDYEDELQMNEVMMQDVITKIPDAPARPRQSQNAQANADSDDEDGPGEDAVDHSVQVPDVPGVSTIDLWKERRQEYSDKYNSKTMQQRYVTKIPIWQ